jgi:hypothetical protein
MKSKQINSILKIKKMGKQDHAFPFTGSIGKLTFYRSKLHGPLVKEKRGVPKERIESEPNFRLTRQNMAEFSRGGKATSLIRKTLKTQLQDISDGHSLSRLTRRLMDIIHLDPINDRGARTVAHGDKTPLRDFDFNTNSALASCFQQDITTVIDRVTGKLTVTIPSFVPTQTIKAPQGSTHFQLAVTGGEFDFEMDKGLEDSSNTGFLLLDGTPTAQKVFEQQLTPNSTGTLILFLGISFYTGVLNGSMERMNNGSFNALKIVDINSL